MAVYFANHGAIDLAAITTMGVSVKEGDAPIGYFGTGVKFAIATLLRTGHRVTLHRCGEAIQFEAREATIREERFGIVHMNGSALGFTTALGKNWEPWQAYRELRSNAMDEGGFAATDCNVEAYDTVFEVVGAGIEEAHRDRASIFLESEPLHRALMCEVHRGTSRVGYYRGIRALTLPKPSLLTYNLTCKQRLTEDRTLAEHWAMANWAADAVPELTDEGLVEQILFAPDGTFERDFTYPETASPSPEFMRVAQRFAHSATINRSAVDLWRKKAQAEVVYEPVHLDALERSHLQAALALCERLGCSLNPTDITVIEDLGEGILGVTRAGRIILSRRCFDMGARMVASTIFEEWLHATQRKQDCSRDMQNYLLDKVFSLVEKLRFSEAAEEHHA